MHLLKILLCFVVLLVLSSINQLWGNGSRLPSQDAWSIALGDAITANIANPSAVYSNPAGLANIGNPEMISGLSLIMPDISFESATGRTVNERSVRFWQPHSFGAIPLARGWTLGFGLFSPFGQATDWPNDSGFAGLATYSKIRFVTGALAIGGRITDTLSFGAGFQFSDAKVTIRRLTALAPTVITQFGYEGSDQTYSGNIGVQWQPVADHRFGLHYQLKSDFTFQGTATLAGVTSQPGSLGWVFPDILAAGWSWDFAPSWTLDTGWDWTNWNRLNTLRLQAGPLSTAVPLNWKSSSYLEVGLAHQYSETWSFAGGVKYSQNSIPDATFSPSLPDVSRVLLNAGAFYRSGRWAIHAVIQRGIPATRYVGSPTTDGLGGSPVGNYKNGLWATDISVLFTF